MSGHESPVAQKEEWLTPPSIVESLGAFDLDPCSPVNRPWSTASNHLTIFDDGLSVPWSGRVWCNPPYGKKTEVWLDRLANHGNGIALIFARTETRAFFKTVWDRADALLFLKGRIRFHHVTGEQAASAGAPSVLVAYGQNNVEALRNSDIEGKLVKL